VAPAVHSPGDGDDGDDHDEDDEQGADVDLVEVVDTQSGRDAGGHERGDDEPCGPSSDEEDPVGEQRPPRALLDDALGEALGEALAANERADPVGRGSEALVECDPYAPGLRIGICGGAAQRFPGRSGRQRGCGH